VASGEAVLAEAALEEAGRTTALRGL
jgi:hypothetical protein